MHHTSSKNTFLITSDWDHYCPPTTEIRTTVFHRLCFLLQLFKYVSWWDHQPGEHPTYRLLFFQSFSIWLTLTLQLAEPRMENQWRLELAISIDEFSRMLFLCHLGLWSSCPVLCLCSTHPFLFNAFLRWSFRLSQRQSNQHSFFMSEAG